MGDQHERPRSGARLLLRAHPTDLGVRPVWPSWQSPDIYRTGGTVSEVAEGVPVQLVARVFNLGDIPALAVRARFWWANSSLGLSKASATFIGQSGLQTVGTGDTVEFTCDQAWTPQALDGGAHPCLVVEAGGVNCPVALSFRPDQDPQVAQHNVTVKSALAGQPLKLRVFNPLPETAVTIVQVRSLRISGDGVRRLSDAMLLDAARPETRRALRRSEVTVSEVDAGAFLRVVEVGEARDDGERPERDALTAGFPRPGDALGGHALCELRLPAWGSAQIVIESARGRRQADEALVHQLVQVSDGQVVGGYSLVERHRGHGF